MPCLSWLHPLAWPQGNRLSQMHQSRLRHGRHDPTDARPRRPTHPTQQPTFRLGPGAPWPPSAMRPAKMHLDDWRSGRQVTGTRNVHLHARPDTYLPPHGLSWSSSTARAAQAVGGHHANAPRPPLCTPAVHHQPPPGHCHAHGTASPNPPPTLACPAPRHGATPPHTCRVAAGRPPRAGPQAGLHR